MSADAGTGHRPPGSPLAVPGFRWLWSGGLVSLAGTQMQRVALPYFVHEQTGSSFATALCAAAQVLPGITLAPLAGSLADRGDPRRLLIGADVVLTAVTLAFCLALVAPWWVVVVVAFLQASVAQLVAPAEAVLVPSLVPAAVLPAANSLNAANDGLARLVGPAAGGLLSAVGGLPLVAVVDAASFAVAALLVGRIDPGSGGTPRADRAPGRRRRVRPARPRAVDGWATGWAEVRRRPLLGRLMVFVVLTGLGEGCVSALLAPYTAEVFGGSTALGLLLTCQAVGGTAGALAVSRRPGVDHLPQTLGAAAIACGTLLAVLISYPLLYPPLHSPLWPALLLVTLAGLPFAVVAAARATLLQTLPGSAVRGSVVGVALAAGGTAQLVGVLASGHLADRLGVHVLLADAPCYVLAGLVVLSGRRRRTRGRRRAANPPAVRVSGRGAR